MKKKKSQISTTVIPVLAGRGRGTEHKIVESNAGCPRIVLLGILGSPCQFEGLRSKSKLKETAIKPE